MGDGVARLSSSGDMTFFSYGGCDVRFRTSSRLVRYLCVTGWDAGYLVCQAQYAGLASPVEEYIDLVPILENLYMDPERFLGQIERVEVCYGREAA